MRERQEGPLIVKRLDDGRHDEKGHFRCAECGWEVEAAYRHAAYYHGLKKHYRKARILHVTPRTPRQLQIRDCQRRFKAKKKVGWLVGWEEETNRKPSLHGIIWFLVWLSLNNCPYI